MYARKCHDGFRTAFSYGYPARRSRTEIPHGYPARRSRTEIPHGDPVRRSRTDIPHGYPVQRSGTEDRGRRSRTASARGRCGTAMGQGSAGCATWRWCRAGRRCRSAPPQRTSTSRASLHPSGSGARRPLPFALHPAPCALNPEPSQRPARPRRTGPQRVAPRVAPASCRGAPAACVTWRAGSLRDVARLRPA